MGDLAEEFILGHALGDAELWQEYLSQAHIDAAALGDHHAVFQRLGDIGKQRRHLVGAFEVLLFGIAAFAARVVQGFTLTNGDAGFVGPEVFPFQKAHIVGGDNRRAGLDRQLNASVYAGLFQRAAGADELQVEAVGKRLLPLFQQLARFPLVLGEQVAANLAFAPARQGNQTFALRQYPLFIEDRPSLALTVGPAFGDQLGQVTVAHVVHRQQRDAIGVRFIVGIREPEIAADDRLQPGALGGFVEFDQAKQVGFIGERQRRHPALSGRADQRLEFDQAIDQRVFTVQTKMNERNRHGTLSIKR